MRKSRASLVSLLVFAGALLVCVSINAQTNSGKLVFSDESNRLLIINADGTGETVLTTGGDIRDGNPVYSPDGSKIAFDRNISGKTNIYVMNADGTNPVRITTSGSNDVLASDPSWSPDGAKLAFVSDKSGNRRTEIWVVNADGTGLVRLTTNVQLGTAGDGPFYDVDTNPSWSPDGSRIAFGSTRDINYQVYVMNVDGSNQTRLTNDSAANLSPSWSPDGQRIAFFRNDNSGTNGRAIYIMNQDGSNKVLVMVDAVAPAWSPDGTRIAFERLVQSNNFKGAVFVVNTDGTNTVMITNNTFNCVSPSWAPTSSPPIPTSTISGHVLDGNGMPVSGASLNLTATFNRSTQTDAAGAYAFAGLPAGNYGINIAKSGFGFIPSSVSFTNLTTNQTANFAAFTSFSISGQVSGLGGNSIFVTLSGTQSGSMLTDVNGHYSFDLLPSGGNYTVSITNHIWNLSPGSATFNNLSSNQVANFSAVRFLYTLSGTIKRLGNPLAGISVDIENGSGFTPPTTNTDSNGHYSFTGVTAGINYTIRPTGANYLFSPQTYTYSSLDADHVGDFVALSANHVLFTTRYVFAGEGNCILQLTVVRGGNAQGVGPITVHYATSDGNAKAGSDYVGVSGTLNFPEGTFSQTITIPFIPNQIVDGPKIFSVDLSNPTGQVDLGDTSSVTVVLTAPASPASLLLATQPNSNRAVALNSANLIAEPFGSSTTINFSPDPKTRVSFFVSGVQFNACQATNTLFYEVTDSQQHHSSGTVEGVVKLPGSNPFLQLSVPLPQGLISGDLVFSFTLGNLTSNTARISIQP